MDTWVHENIGLVLPGLAERPAEERLHAFRVAKQQMSENTDLYLAFLELLPEILRDERHSERITALYEWAMETYSRILADDLPDLTPREMRGFTKLIIAVVDGLAVQHAMNPERLGTGEAYDMLESILDVWISTRRSAGAVAAAQGDGVDRETHQGGGPPLTANPNPATSDDASTLEGVRPASPFLTTGHADVPPSLALRVPDDRAHLLGGALGSGVGTWVARISRAWAVARSAMSVEPVGAPLLADAAVDQRGLRSGCACGAGCLRG